MAKGRTNAKGPAGEAGNYSLLFYKGNQMPALTGGYTEQKYALSGTASVELVPNMVLSCPSSSADNYVIMRSNKKVDLSKYDKLICHGLRVTRPDDYFVGIYTTDEIQPYSIAATGAPGTGSVVGSGARLRIHFPKRGVMSVPIGGVGEQYLYLCAGSGNTLSTTSIWLAKQDDWTPLCTMLGLDAANYADEEEFFLDYDAMEMLFENQSAVELLSTYSGSVLAAFMASDDAVYCLEESAYAPIVYNNPHWCKFLAVLV